MFTPMHIHSHYSFDSAMKFDQLIDRLKECQYNTATLTDHGTMCGNYDLFFNLQEEKIKPIAGVELYTPLMDASIKEDCNRQNLHMVCLAKNYEGFKRLCKITSRSNHEDVYYYKPRLDIERLKELTTDDLMWFTGHPGSLLYNVITSESGFHKNAVERGIKFMNRMKDYFGKSNVFIEVQRTCHFDEDLNTILNEIAKKTDVKATACIDAHYAKKEHAKFQRIILASSLKTTLKRWKNKLGDKSLSSFFEKDYYYIPTIKELEKVHTVEEMENNYLINELCEDYKLEKQPSLPEFDCPNNKSEEEYLLDLTNEGIEFLSSKYPIDEDKYRSRVKEEMKTIAGFNLNGYFLIVRDLILECENSGGFVGPGRGCFTPETRIRMKDGSYKPISSIKIDDVVIDKNGMNQKVYDTMSYNIEEEIIEIEFSNNKTIRCTKDHKFLTNNRGWVEAQNLTEKDDIKEV